MIDQSRKEQTATRLALKLGECPRGQACVVGRLVDQSSHGIGKDDEIVAELVDFFPKLARRHSTIKLLFALHANSTTLARIPATIDVDAILSLAWSTMGHCLRIYKDALEQHSAFAR